MNKEKEIAEVMKILKKNRNKFTTPVVTEVANVTESPYQVLISCLLSLRTLDATTAKVSERLFKVAKTPRQMNKLSLRQLAKIIRPVNYYRTKSKRIRQISKEILQKYKGKVPDDFDTLMKFKGVGRKTANIVMVYGFGKQGLPIDTHCHRIPNRLGWIKTKTPEQTEKELRKILPKTYWHDFNDLFVQFGQNICRPAGPKCDACPVRKCCKYQKTRS